jgi:hypothetical protein
MKIKDIERKFLGIINCNEIFVLKVNNRKYGCDSEADGVNYNPSGWMFVFMY